MPQFETTYFVAQIFWMLLSFSVLYLGVRWIVFPLFENIFSKRAQLISVPVEKAEKLAHESEKLQEQLEQKQRDFTAKNEQYLNAVYQKNNQHFQESLQQADKSFTTLLKKTIQKMEKEEKQVLNQTDEFVSRATKGVL